MISLAPHSICLILKAKSLYNPTPRIELNLGLISLFDPVRLQAKELRPVDRDKIGSLYLVAAFKMIARAKEARDYAIYRSACRNG